MDVELSSVQCKVCCVFDVDVKNTPSDKRPEQSYSVSAGHRLTTKIDVNEFSENCVATEKLDGTCCLVDNDDSRGGGGDTTSSIYSLYARFDRKPNKSAEKRFKAFMLNSEEDRIKCPFVWKSLEEDFKPIPDNWKPNIKAEYDDNGEIIPDQSAHIIGWVPVRDGATQPAYKWHALPLDYGGVEPRILVLTPSGEADTLIIEFRSLRQCKGKTFELIGTNINRNSYKLGSKKAPFLIYVSLPSGLFIEIGLNSGPLISRYECIIESLLITNIIQVQHGALKLQDVPNLKSDKLKERLIEWFSKDHTRSKVEGIVWHGNNQLLKFHRGHVKLKWPLLDEELNLHKYKIKIMMTAPTVSLNNSMLNKLYSYNGKIFNSIVDISLI